MRRQITVLFLLAMFPCAWGQIDEEPAPSKKADSIRQVSRLAKGVSYFVSAIPEESEGKKPALDRAIVEFSAIIEADPTNELALLYRALSHGEHALIARSFKSENKWTIDLLTEVDELPKESLPAQVRQLIERLERLESIQLGEPPESAQHKMAVSTTAVVIEMLSRFLKPEDQELDRPDAELAAKGPSVRQTFALAVTEKRELLVRVCDRMLAEEGAPASKRAGWANGIKGFLGATVAGAQPQPGGADGESFAEYPSLGKILNEYETLVAKQAGSDLSAAEAKMVEGALKLNQDIRDQVLAIWAGKDLKAARTEAATQFYKYAAQERSHYEQVLADLETLISNTSQPDDVIRLVEVVAAANAARIIEQQEVGLEAGQLAPDGLQEEETTTGELQEASQSLMRRVETTLRTILSDVPEGATKYRSQFFLGVICYRQAVPLAPPTSSQSTAQRARSIPSVNQKQLREGIGLMKELYHDANVPEEWREYAAFYLSLMIPHLASGLSNSSSISEVLKEAGLYVEYALSLDAVVHPQESSGIPELAYRQQNQLEKLREQVEAGSRVNELSVRLHSGARYDTNVILLGDNVATPKSISDEKDYGLVAGASIDYTCMSTERISLALQVRTAQIWQYDIREYDQEIYGASAAIQYRLLEKSADWGPLFASMQVDYDHTRLGDEGFLSASGITPSLRLMGFDEAAQLDLYYNFQRRDYNEALANLRVDRDGDYQRIGSIVRVKAVDLAPWIEKQGWPVWGAQADDALARHEPDFPRRYLIPYSGVAYAWDSTKGDEYDRGAINLLCGLEIPLPWGVTLDTSAKWEWEEYRQGSLFDFHRRAREDFIQEYGFSLSRKFVLKSGARRNRVDTLLDRTLMTLRAFATWTDDDGNVQDRRGEAPYSYERIVFGINVEFEFN